MCLSVSLVHRSACGTFLIHWCILLQKLVFISGRAWTSWAGWLYLGAIVIADQEVSDWQTGFLDVSTWGMLLSRLGRRVSDDKHLTSTGSSYTIAKCCCYGDGKTKAMKLGFPSSSLSSLFLSLSSLPLFLLALHLHENHHTDIRPANRHNTSMQM